MELLYYFWCICHFRTTLLNPHFFLISPNQIPRFMAIKKSDTQELTFNDFKSSVLRDYKIACESREMSLMGRREVLSER